MKFLITAVFVFIYITLLARQKSVQTSTTIDDDGNRLKLIVFANTDKGIINYNKDFDIKGMSQEQKEMIINHVMDSLGLQRINNSNNKTNSASSSQSSVNNEFWKIVEKFNAQQVEQFNKGNLLGVAQFYSDDAMIYHPGKIYRGREAINKYWEDIKGGKSWRLTIKEVGGSKNSFWVAGLSELTVVNNGVDRTYASNYIVIMQPDKNGDYKIYKDIYNQAANN